MRNGIRCIHAVVVISLIIESKLRIEEIELLVEIEDNLLVIFVPCVRKSRHLNAHMPILQVGKGTQTLDELPVYLSVNIAVHLLSVVVVILVIRLQCGGSHLIHILLFAVGFLYLIERGTRPNDFSKVAAHIFVPTATNVGSQSTVVVIVNGTYGTIKIVVHPLLAHQVAQQLGVC